MFAIACGQPPPSITSSRLKLRSLLDSPRSPVITAAAHAPGEASQAPEPPGPAALDRGAVGGVTPGPAAAEAVPDPVSATGPGSSQTVDRVPATVRADAHLGAPAPRLRSGPRLDHEPRRATPDAGAQGHADAVPERHRRARAAQRAPPAARPPAPRDRRRARRGPAPRRALRTGAVEKATAWRRPWPTARALLSKCPQRRAASACARASRAAPPARGDDFAPSDRRTRATTAPDPSARRRAPAAAFAQVPVRRRSTASWASERRPSQAPAAAGTLRRIRSRPERRACA